MSNTILDYNRPFLPYNVRNDVNLKTVKGENPVKRGLSRRNEQQIKMSIIWNGNKLRGKACAKSINLQDR